ncbi:MAG: hypothetical protein GY719_13925 [bacterium]|nr:hypothetical protein [bacterium]
MVDGSHLRYGAGFSNNLRALFKLSKFLLLAGWILIGVAAIMLIYFAAFGGYELVARGVFNPRHLVELTLLAGPVALVGLSLLAVALVSRCLLAIELNTRTAAELLVRNSRGTQVESQPVSESFDRRLEESFDSD